MTFIVDIQPNREIDKQTLERALDFTLPEPNYVMSYFKPDGLVILGFANYTKDKDIELYIVGVGNWASRFMLKHAFNYIFNECNCFRCTVRVKDDNKESITLVEKLGFVKEGYLRGLETSIYSLLKNECKYL